MKLSNKVYLLAAIAGIQFITACNKDLETVAAPATVTPPVPTGDTIRKFISANSKYALFDSCLNMTGLKNTVLNQTGNLTVFAADTTAYKQLAYGLSVAAGAPNIGLLSAPNAAVAGFFRAFVLPTGSLRSIMQYNIMEGKIASANMSINFPNITYPSFVRLDPVNAANDALRLPIGLSLKGGTQGYLNSIPLRTLDVFTGFNGVVHESPAVNVPPSGTLKTLMAADTALVYFRAAVARADSGAVGTSRFDSLLNYGVTNMTVLTPNNLALRTVLFGAIYQGAYPSVYAVLYPLVYNGAIAGGATPAIADSIAKARVADTTAARATAASSPAALPTAGFNLLPLATVKGIIAYHFLATNPTGSYQPNVRVFSVNIPSTAAFVKTLVNAGVAIHPGVAAQATFAGPVTSSVTFTGVGNGGVAANVISKDKNAANGVYHIIDRVLLPQ